MFEVTTQRKKLELINSVTINSISLILIKEKKSVPGLELCRSGPGSIQKKKGKGEGGAP